MMPASPPLAPEESGAQACRACCAGKPVHRMGNISLTCCSLSEIQGSCSLFQGREKLTEEHSAASIVVHSIWFLVNLGAWVCICTDRSACCHALDDAITSNITGYLYDLLRVVQDSLAGSYNVHWGIAGLVRMAIAAGCALS